MASVTPVLGVMLGLAVGIDYSLFIVNRHRSSCARAPSCASRSVSPTAPPATRSSSPARPCWSPCSRSTSPASRSSASWAPSARSASLVAVLIAVTLTPAHARLIGAAGAEQAPARARSPAHRTAAAPAKPMSTVRAVPPCCSPRRCCSSSRSPRCRCGSACPTARPRREDSTQYRAYQIIAEEFGEGANGPLLVTATTPSRSPTTTCSRPRPRSRGCSTTQDRRGRRRADRHLRRPAVARLPGDPRRGSEQRLDRGAGTELRGLSPLEARPSTATSCSASPASRRATSTSRQARRRPAALPRRRDRALAAHHDRRLPLAAGAARRDGGLHPVALRDLRRPRRRLPVGLVLDGLRRARPRRRS